MDNSTPVENPPAAASGPHDGSIIVSQEWRRHTVGQRVRVRLGDGTP
ncbi:hypothetical protein ABZX30_06655 [Streptomyces sp. NPDC004542]